MQNRFPSNKFPKKSHWNWSPKSPIIQYIYIFIFIISKQNSYIFTLLKTIFVIWLKTNSLFFLLLQVYYVFIFPSSVITHFCPNQLCKPGLLSKVFNFDNWKWKKFHVIRVDCIYILYFLNSHFFSI